MNWFQEQRLAWIAETIEVFEFINREHLVRKFRISVPQASMDLNKFQRLYPGKITYDANGLRYVKALTPAQVAGREMHHGR